MQTVCIDRYKHKFQTMIPLTSPYLEDCSVKSKCTFKYEKKKKKGSSSMNVVQRYPSSGSILGTHLIINIYWGPAPCQAVCYLLGVRID